MYTTGHCGVTLLVYVPVGFGLFLTGQESAAFAGGAIVLAFMMLPDCDHGIPFLAHRGPTHTLLFALLIGALLGASTATVIPYRGARVGASLFAFAIGTFAIITHLIADLLTPMGIEPFWPLSNKRYSLQLTSARSPAANNLLLGLGVLATTASLYLLDVIT